MNDNNNFSNSNQFNQCEQINCCLNSCQYATTITALACAILQNISSEEVSVLAASFTQLGDTLATMIVREEICNSRLEKLQ